MNFWVDASLFALLVWGGQHALFLVCALACVVGPRLVPTATRPAVRTRTRTPVAV